MAANRAVDLLWRSDSIAKLMRRNKIHDRRDLSKRIDQPYSTVCSNLSPGWTGRVKTIPLLTTMCQTFHVPLSKLVVEPRDQ